MAETIDPARAQLFLDDELVEDCTHVGRIWHQPRKYPDPVLRADRSWERNCPVLYGTVLERQGRLQMWYCAWTRHTPPMVCYAESADGIVWEKPDLGIHEYGGNRDNNIVIRSTAADGLIDNISVIDDHDDAVWPLKALYWDSGSRSVDKAVRGHGIFASRSKDGIRWYPMGKVLPEWGDRFNAVARRFRGTLVLMGRAPGGYSLGPDGRERVVAYTESEDLVRWSAPALVLAPDADDPPRMQFYSATAFPYEGMLLGSIERMHMAPDKLDVEIIWSRDGKNWTRSRKRPQFIEWGLPGSFDSDWINLPSNGPIAREGNLWFYYSGRSGAHGAPYPLNHGGVGLAVLRTDGFCSLRAEERPGAVLTKPMSWIDGELRINMDPRRDLSAHPQFTCGWVRVEIRDAANTPVPGLTLQDSIPMEENTVSGPRCSGTVRWAGGRSLRQLKGKTIRIFFQMKDAHLYSFHAGDDAS